MFYYIFILYKMFQQKDGVPEEFELAQRAGLFADDKTIKDALTKARNASFNLYKRKRETDTIPLEELTEKDLEARKELDRQIEDAFQRKQKATSQTDQSPIKKVRRDDLTGGKASKRRKSRKSRKSRRRQKK
jgi:hypothetical protein